MTENELLRRVSRSFYLTIRLLPGAMRNDVSLAYLLARGADTVADSPGGEPEKCLEVLKAARASLVRPEIAGYRAQEWAELQRDPADRRLLEAWPDLWRRMAARTGHDRDRLQVVLGHILDGQIFDQERFGGDRPPLTSDELERYTYLVAGSVGEFWTDLGFARLGNFSPETPETMRSMGRHYGQGLQLVNILRDRRMDAAMGRVYVDAADVAHWRGRARVWLEEGARYCAALSSGRVRYACLLPALLGWRTLALVESHPAEFLAPAKVPRIEVRRWMWRALAAWWSPGAVARLAREASGL